MSKAQQTLLNYFKPKMTSDAILESTASGFSPIKNTNIEFYLLNILRKQEQQSRQIQELYKELKTVKEQYKRHCYKNVAKKIVAFQEKRIPCCSFKEFVQNLFRPMNHLSLERIWSNRTIFESFKEELAIQLKNVSELSQLPILCFQERKHRVWVYGPSPDDQTINVWRTILFKDVDVLLFVYQQNILNLWIEWDDQQMADEKTETDYYTARFDNYISKKWDFMNDDNKKMKITHLLYEHLAIPLP